MTEPVGPEGPRHWMTKLQAILHDLNDKYESHLYWQSIQSATHKTTVGMNFVLERDAKREDGPSVQIDLMLLPTELMLAVVADQLRRTFVQYCQAWDEVHKLSTAVLGALSAPSSPEPQ